VAVSDPSDAFEQQADAVASQVMAEPTPIAHSTGSAAVGLQRSCGEGCSCAACQDPSRHPETTGSIETVSRLVIQRQDICDPSVESCPPPVCDPTIASCPAGTVDPNGNPNPPTMMSEEGPTSEEGESLPGGPGMERTVPSGTKQKDCYCVCSWPDPTKEGSRCIINPGRKPDLDACKSACEAQDPPYPCTRPVNAFCG
jgi:hypothetical protein